MINLGSLYVGLDPGTANTLLYVKGRGIALNEPSVLTIRAGTERIEFVGEEAQVGRGRIPRKFDLRSPIRRGIIIDSRMFQAMLLAFLRRANVKPRIGRLRIAIAAPSGLEERERQTMVRIVRGAMDADICPIDQALAAASGAGLSLSDTEACAIVNIGAGATQIAVLSRASVARTRFLPVAGQDLDAAIAASTEATCGLLIGEITAELVKIRLGSAAGAIGREFLPVVGRSVAEGVPQRAMIAAGQVREAILPVVERIVDVVAETLEAAPPQLLRRVAETGVVLTGGLASLRGLDQLMADRCGLPVRVADDPASCVARGLGVYLDQLRSHGWEAAASFSGSPAR